MRVTPTPAPTPASRRDLLKATAALAVGTLGLGETARAFVQATQAATRAIGSDVLRVGLIGCGGRGLGAVKDAIRAAPGVEVHAIGDVFPDQTAAARGSIETDRDLSIRAACKLTDDTCFSGFDAYHHVIAAVDYVLIACPPYFHPHFVAAAVDAGKHVFCEKPGAVDASGVRILLAAGEKAQRQKTGFLAGTQRRHQLSYLETIKRIHDGAVGRPIYGEAFWNNREWVVVPREPGWSDVEWQLRNWRQNRWLSGDAPGVLVIHYLDAVNWALGAQPQSAIGTGGRSVYTDPALYGNIYDHFEANLTYADGQRVHAMCRNWPGDAPHAEFVLGTAGSAELGSEVRGEGGPEYNFRRAYGKEEPSPYVLAHRDMIASIRVGRPINEAEQLADATLATMLVREAAYTGRVVTRDFLLSESQRVLGPQGSPDGMTFGDHDTGPVPVPGDYELK